MYLQSINQTLQCKNMIPHLNLLYNSQNQFTNEIVLYRLNLILRIMDNN